MLSLSFLFDLCNFTCKPLPPLFCYKPRWRGNKGRDEYLYRLALQARTVKHDIDLTEAKGAAAKRKHKQKGRKQSAEEGAGEAGGAHVNRQS